jgi:hypothetical protein
MKISKIYHKLEALWDAFQMRRKSDTFFTGFLVVCADRLNFYALKVFVVSSV